MNSVKFDFISFLVHSMSQQIVVYIKQGRVKTSPCMPFFFTFLYVLNLDLK